MKKPYYPNLEAELARNGLNNCDLAKIIGIRDQAQASKKRTGYINFTEKQKKMLCERLQETEEYLFDTE